MKILGIGLSKTGTTSLADALETLGFPTKSFPTSASQIALFDAAVDTPVASAFEELDLQYPQSRFIYSIRPLRPWLRSCQAMWFRRSKFFSSVKSISRLHEKLYGTNSFDPNLFTQAYLRHDSRIIEYFKYRQHDLLTIDLTTGEPSWNALCQFLHQEIPNITFPHSNDTDAVLGLIRHISRTLGEIHSTLAVTGVPEHVLSDIVQGADRVDPQIPPLGTDWETRLMLNNAITYFGTIPAACQALHLPTVAVKIALGMQVTDE